MAETILNEVTGIDVVLIGHTFKNLETERITHDAVVLAAVHEGRFIGRADLRIDPANGKVMAVEVTVTGPRRDRRRRPDHGRAKLAAFKASLDQAKAEQRAKFPRDLGSQPTRSSWAPSIAAPATRPTTRSGTTPAHAKAHTSLRPQNMENEPECLVCHTTGYRYQGGYEEDGDKRSLVNVQCEACHGYGTEHARDGKWLKQAKESCTECHDDAKRPCATRPGAPFDYAEYWEKIKH